MSPREGTTGPSLDLDLQKPRLLSPPSQVEGLAEGGASPLRPAPTRPPTQHRWDGPEIHLRDFTHLCNNQIPVSPSNPSSSLPPDYSPQILPFPDLPCSSQHCLLSEVPAIPGDQASVTSLKIQALAGLPRDPRPLGRAHLSPSLHTFLPPRSALSPPVFLALF